MNSFSKFSEIREGYRSKKFSPVEVTQFYLDQIKKSKHNAYLDICEDRVLDQAKKVEKIIFSDKDAFEKYPLLGMPMGIKDLLNIDGVKTTCASKMLENYVAPYTATCVERLEKAGALSLGKLNLDEFAMGSSNENSAFGPVEHPTHPERVPGGSSGGSATAVGADLCLTSLGTDTGGSIRLPASFCGVVGYKPTYGRVSRFGVVAFASSLDQVGPFAKTVEDAALVAEVMSGKDIYDSTSSSESVGAWSSEISKPMDWKSLKVGVPKEYFVEGVEDSVRKSVEESLRWFESKGATLVDISLPHTEYAVSTYYVVAVSEASSNLARFDGVRFGTRPDGANESATLDEFYEKVRSQFGAEVKRRIILGTYALSSGYYDAYYSKACKVRRLIRNDFDEAFKKVDVIAGPVAPTVAFKRGAMLENPLQMYLMDIFTIPASLSGLPALSVPCGTQEDGLSIGLHLIGSPFADEKVLKVAHHFQKERYHG
ncbi:MAG: Asp-tRNA(Asn)/Glu-tRNA(Gln) amidotransferase GatCAB subunit A [Bdellovibrionaceae bacterium]|nr:Asp-tRNA(Asn)/Glu-tRNA(Gln) amidotransferase GatCAB subunit A [Pseudobdellovibrionaceae bacterium]